MSRPEKRPAGLAESAVEVLHAVLDDGILEGCYTPQQGNSSALWLARTSLNRFREYGPVWNLVAALCFGWPGGGGAARKKELTKTMPPEDYRPVYDDTVREYLENDLTRAPQPINKLYCLTYASARLLAGLFSPIPVIYMAPPTAQDLGSPFKFNHNVPWFLWPGPGGGVRRNAGVLAQYWGAGEGYGMPGVPFDKALDYAKLDVATPVEGQPPIIAE